MDEKPAKPPHVGWTVAQELFFSEVMAALAARHYHGHQSSAESRAAAIVEGQRVLAETKVIIDRYRREHPDAA